MGRCGRTYRKRCHRKDGEVGNVVEPKIIDLTKWLKKNGFDTRSRHLKVHTFPDTGRGLMALKTFKPGECLISIPEYLLITTTTVLNSDLGELIQRFSESRLSPLEALCSFLITERHKGQGSRWFPYIDILPQSYSLPFYWTPEERHLLPKSLHIRAEEQLSLLNSSYRRLVGFFRLVESELPYARGALSYGTFLWAWSSVNTRCVFLERPHHPAFNGEVDHFALAPFLDFFNHSPSAQVSVKFDNKEHSYKIQTLSRVAKFSEAFINYGPHDSSKLILEYGFSVPHNPHDTVRFTIDDILSVCQRHMLCTDLADKETFLKKFNLSSGLCCSADGLSWNLLAAVRILTAAGVDKECLMNVYLDEELTATKTPKCLGIIKDLLSQTLSAIPDDAKWHSETTYHQRLAVDLCSTYRTFLNRTLTDLC